jgi:hypothetical protein
VQPRQVVHEADGAGVGWVIEDLPDRTRFGNTAVAQHDCGLEEGSSRVLARQR